MPTIDKRYLLSLLLVTAALTGLLFGVHAFQSRRIPEALRRQAERATAEGNTDFAIRYLRQYLEFRPNDTDVRVELAQRLLARGSTGELAFLYDSILRADPDRIEVRKSAIELALKSARFTDAVDHADRYLESRPVDVTVWLQKADALAALHRMDDATNAYEQAIRCAPADRTAFREYITFLWTEANDSAKARKAADRMIAAIPDHPEPYLLRARIAMADGGAAAASESVGADLDRARRIDPKSAEAMALKADWFQRKNQLSEARALLEEGIQAHPHDVRFPKRLAWLDVNRGHLTAAVATLEQSLKTVQQGFDELLIPLGDLLVQLGETRRAEEIVATLKSRKGTLPAIQARYISARLAMRSQAWDDAIAGLTTLRRDSVSIPGMNVQANLLLAMCFRMTAQTALERECLLLILNRDPLHVPARVALAQSYLNAGDASHALSEYEAALKSPYASGTTAATAIRLKALRLRSAELPPRSAIQDLEQAAMATKSRFGEGSSEPVILRAEIMALFGEPDRAAAVLRSEATKRPHDSRLWSALAEATGSAYGIAAGLTVCDEAEAICGDRVELRLTRAGLISRDPLKLRTLTGLDRGIETWNDADQTLLLNGLVEALDRRGDLPAMARMFRRVASRQSNDAATWFSVFEQAIRAGESSVERDALTALTRIQQGERSDLAALMVRWYKANAAERETLAPQILDRLGAEPKLPAACLLAAEAARNRGEADRARALVQRALKLDATGFETHRRALALLAQADETVLLESTLQRLNTDPRWTTDAIRRCIQGAVTRENAGRLLASAAKQLPRDANASGWLGDCWRMAGNPAETDRCYRLGIESRLANADDWLRLASISNPDTARGAMMAAATKLPKPLFLNAAASFAVHPAGAAWSPPLAGPDDRLLFAKAQVAFHMANQEPDRALAVLESLVSKADCRPADRAWAQKNQAMILTARGRPEDRTHAAELLLREPVLPETPLDERRSTAAMLVTLHKYLSGEERTRVLTRAAELIADSVSPRDRFLRFQILRADGRPEQRQLARTLLNELLKSDPKNLDYLLAGFDELTEAGERTVAPQFADALRKQHPNRAEAVAALCHFDATTGQSDRCLLQIEELIRAHGSTTMIARAASLLDDLARLPQLKGSPAADQFVRAAVAKYELLLPERLEAIPAAAGLLAWSGQSAAARDFLGKHAAILNPRIRAAANLAMLRSGDRSVESIARARQAIDDVVRLEPDALVPQLNLGEFLVLTGDLSGAESVFTRILDREPENLFALNNLAWVLAPRADRAKEALALVERAARVSGYTPELLDTRARILIASQQPKLAEKDLLAALNQEKTPLRYFHLALAKQSDSPVSREAVRTALQSARERGLEPRMVHPADVERLKQWERDGQ